jgi:hypothetical protein
VVGGWISRGPRAPRPLALVLYPTLFISVLELPRVFYLGDIRAVVPMVLGIGMIAASRLIFGPVAAKPAVRPSPTA